MSSLLGGLVGKTGENPSWIGNRPISDRDPELGDWRKSSDVGNMPPEREKGQGGVLQTLDYFKGWVDENFDPKTARHIKKAADDYTTQKIRGMLTDVAPSQTTPYYFYPTTQTPEWHGLQRTLNTPIVDPYETEVAEAEKLTRTHGRRKADQ